MPEKGVVIKDILLVLEWWNYSGIMRVLHRTSQAKERDGKVCLYQSDERVKREHQHHSISATYDHR